MSQAFGAQAEPRGAGPERDRVELCWHCQSRPADPAAARPLELRRYSGPRVERTHVLVPACRTCRRARRTITFLWLGMLVAWVVLASVGVVVIASPGDDGEAVRTVWALVITLPPFVVMLPVGLIAQVRIANRAAIRNLSPASYPPVQRLKAAGWTTARMTRSAYRAGQATLAGLARLDQLAEEGRRTTIAKSCSSCGRAVSPTAKVGERCPHCGAYWSTESWR